MTTKRLNVGRTSFKLTKNKVSEMPLDVQKLAEKEERNLALKFLQLQDYCNSLIDLLVTDGLMRRNGDNVELWVDDKWIEFNQPSKGNSK